jgi:glutathione synthase/RimK-type ligase-like ATP-grasp enzyme
MTDLAHRSALESELARIEALSAAQAPTTDLLFRQAVLLNDLGRIDEAKSVYLEILKIDSTHLGALSNLGGLLYEMNFREAAITLFNRIIQCYPNEAVGHVNLATVLWDHDDHAGARFHYEAALKIDPDCPEAHQGMACVLMEIREDDAAWEHGQKGFAGRPCQVIACRGSREPVSVLVLNSVAGGNTPLRRAIDNQVFTTTLLATEFYDPARPLPEHQVVWNAIGDADLGGKALHTAAELLRKTGAPVINRPEAVALTGRECMTKRLAGIKNLLLPKTVRMSRSALERDDAKAALEAMGFRFPVLLRALGFHAGKHFIKAAGADNLRAGLAAMPGGEFAVIQFLDVPGKDGNYRKYRVMTIDGKFYPLHAAISRNWKIHYFSADMAENAAHRAEDGDFLLDMPSVLGPAAMATLEEIRSAVSLDYAGIDFGMTAKGEILFFEANAAMVILPPGRGEQWDYRRAPVQKALDAVTAMLLSRSEAVT